MDKWVIVTGYDNKNLDSAEKAAQHKLNSEEATGKLTHIHTDNALFVLSLSECSRNNHND